MKIFGRARRQIWRQRRSAPATPTMQSVIIVEQELRDSVKSYSQVLDGTGEGAPTFSQYFRAAPTADDELHAEVSDADGLSAALVALIPRLGALVDRDFEPTFNLVLHVLAELHHQLVAQALDRYPEVVAHLVALNPAQQPTLRDRRAIKASLVLLLLNNVFNLLPPLLAHRLAVIDAILAVAEGLHLHFDAMARFGDLLVTWLEAAGASDERLRATFWRYVALDNEFGDATLWQVKRFVDHHRLALVLELRSLIVFAMQSQRTDVLFLVNANVSAAIAQWRDDELVAQFDRFIRGELVSVEHLPKVAAKLRILALCRYLAELLAQQLPRGVFRYADIPRELAANAMDLELLLIQAIKAGVLEGRLSQLDQTLHLTRANRFVYYGAEQNARNWDDVERVLYDWRNALQNIREIVNTSRENIVNNQA
jgi:translation initiation factor 3 subunit M